MPCIASANSFYFLERGTMYRLSARQILIIALISAVFAATAVAVLDRLSNRLQPAGSAFSEKAPAGITDPAIAPDEQNNIEIYRAVAPGVVNVNSTSYARDFFGFVEPQEGRAPARSSTRMATF